MVEWKPPPTPPEASSSSSHHHHHHHTHYHRPQPNLPQSFRLPPPPQQHPESSHPQPYPDSFPPHKRERVSDHESPNARLDHSSPPHHSYKPHPRRDSSPMRPARSYADEGPVSHSPGVLGSSPETYQGHTQPPPEFTRRRSEMDMHGVSYGPVHTLGEHMREQQMHHHSVTPPGPPYPPHHLDTSVGAAYGPHSQPHSAPPYQPQPYPYGGYDTPNGTLQDSAQKRKAVRASQACDNCRAKKAKCDEQKPCGNCVTNAVACHFRDIQPPKQERSMLQLTETVNQLSHGLQTIEGRMQQVQGLLQAVAHRFDPNMPLSPNDYGAKESFYSNADHMHGPSRMRLSDHHAASQSNHGEYEPDSYNVQNLKAESSDASRSGRASNRGRSDQPDEPVQPRDEEISRDLERRREEAQQDMLNGNVSVAPTHFTAANHLVDWPSISPSFANIARRDYVKRGEHYHSLQLRSLFHRPVKVEPAGSSGPAGSPATHSDQDDSSTISNLSDGRPAMAFVKQGSEGSKGLHPTPGGRNPRDQSLSIDKETSYRLLESFLENVHILQPFLDKDYTYSLLDKFITLYCSEPAQPCSPFAVLESSIERSDSRGPGNNAKRRKYSHGPGSDSNQTKSSSPKIPIERTLDNALILLIFALGKACEHQGPLPALIGEVKTVPVGTPVPAGVICTPCASARGSTPLMTVSHGQGADGIKVKRGHDDSSAPPEHRGSDPYSQDIDRVPGLAYYIHAVQILGEAHGETSLSNVQAQLLAGLYMGQLLRVNDSYRWICSACITWQMLFKQSNNEVRKISEDERKTFWACLVLESDIVAEHDCIQSGISKWEDQMLYPALDDPPESAELECKVYFLAQIAIRKILNRAHSALYTLEEDKLKNQEWQRLSSQDLAEQLEAWRDGLPKKMQWDDHSPLATTINGARLRGKYWGARYVIFRNYIKDVLHPEQASTTPEQESHIAAKDDTEFKTQYEKQKDAIARASDCIEAAKASTVAFDGIPGMRKRLIVTNPFGTAQAQFSNILVLCAAFNASSLHGHVPQHEIVALIDRTYEFLSNLSHLSPTMNTNLKILDRCRHRVLNEGGSAPNSAHHSFNA